ncbi:MAG: hypothetical protein EBS09_11135 [Flavobacteriia bacterium]|nr:hypothetical protein [Flavobacteriia bacterium]
MSGKTKCAKMCGWLFFLSFDGRTVGLLGLLVTVCKQAIDPPLIQIVSSKLDLFFHNRTYLRRKKSGWRLLAVMHSALIFKQAL